MSSRRFRFTVPAVLVASLVAASLAVAASQGPKRHNQANQFQAVLIGHNEVPAVHTNGQGRLSLTIADDEQSIAFELTYSNLINPAQVAHVHFAQPNVNGAVSFFFCGGGKPACPAGNTSTPVTVTGTVNPADVAGVTSQGLVAGDIGAIIQEIREGFAYANVHTTTSPGGEIRGQLDEARGHGHDDDDD